MSEGKLKLDAEFKKWRERMESMQWARQVTSHEDMALGMANLYEEPDSFFETPLTEERKQRIQKTLKLGLDSLAKHHVFARRSIAEVAGLLCDASITQARRRIEKIFPDVVRPDSTDGNQYNQYLGEPLPGEYVIYSRDVKKYDTEMKEREPQRKIIAANIDALRDFIGTTIIHFTTELQKKENEGKREKDNAV